MASDDSSGSSHACDCVQGMGALRFRLQIQEAGLRALAESVDHRFQAFEGHFDAITDRLDALVLGANRGGNENRRRLREDVAQGQPVNKLVPVYNRRELV